MRAAKRDGDAALRSIGVLVAHFSAHGSESGLLRFFHGVETQRHFGRRGEAQIHPLRLQQPVAAGFGNDGVIAERKVFEAERTVGLQRGAAPLAFESNGDAVEIGGRLAVGQEHQGPAGNRSGAALGPDRRECGVLGAVVHRSFDDHRHGDSGKAAFR
ncbi:MAG: hypothetical protein BWZ10_03372 [candidate division BRC1 bacterium ADurb.BinA364]|nr:MAG: hypothetical protein BWZ10_03372 [candidate division BRC1 bacterium ADurb.BinA364]